jgi:hypothetical protein
MKHLTFIAALLTAFSAFAYEINTDLAPTVSPRVIAEIRENFDKNCGSVTENVSMLILDEIQVVRERIDQGYIEDHYSMNFKIIFNDGDAARLSINIVDQIEDRSGRLETYVTEMRTEFGRSGDPVCHQ